MNVLILSCGTRNEIVEMFKSESKVDKVLAGDCSKYAPALYCADKYYIVPRIHQKDYIYSIISICKAEKIDLVISLIDPEVKILSSFKELFIKNDISILVEDESIIELCNYKSKMNEFLEKQGFYFLRTYNELTRFLEDYNLGIVRFPVFLKENDGSASKNTILVKSLEELHLAFNNKENMIIQEYIEAEEYGIDAYIDLLSGEVISIFIKKKIKMRAGETDKAISIIDKKFQDYIKSFLIKLDYRGVLDIDVLKFEDKYFIIDVNPRFGGGYPLAYHCGINFPRLIANNFYNETNEKNFEYQEGCMMFKYSKSMICKL